MNLVHEPPIPRRNTEFVCDVDRREVYTCSGRSVDEPMSPDPSADPTAKPTRDATAWWLLLLPSILMVALTLLPSVAARGPLRVHVWAAAGLGAVAVLATSRRRPFTMVTTIRRPHYMQALTQTGVFVYWGMHWEPVAGFVPLIAVQLLFAYQVDALLAWRRGDRYALGFGPLPVILSINLFMWFRDEYFGWQPVMVALCYVAKYVIAWQRDGRRRHIFNPSSFGLAVISLGLVLSGTSDLTYGREIALTQDDAPYFIHVLFVLGLIVQLQFGVVLITASAAVSTWLLGVGFFALTGVYMFATTDIPAAVFLGMLLLVTDPATSPRGTRAKVLFGAAYGALAFASYPVLEAMGSLGYYDKLLPVPLLNLLVRRFERWGGRRPGSSGPSGPSSGRNLLHVGVWAGIFGLLVATDAVTRDHPGRDILMWQRACAEQRFAGCRTYFKLLEHDCGTGRGEACHNLGVELLEREQQGRPIAGRSARAYVDKACTLGIDLSCQLLATLPAEGSTSGTAAVVAGPQGPPDADPMTALTRACDGGDATACQGLAELVARGTPTTLPDPDRAQALYERGCELGSVSSCSSFAAMVMRSGNGDAAMAQQAFSRACELGDATGCANLAGMYMMGDGVEQDLARAAEYNDKACGLGLGVACARLAQAYAQGQGVEVDRPRAQELAGQACAHGFAPACAPPQP